MQPHPAIKVPHRSAKSVTKVTTFLTTFILANNPRNMVIKKEKGSPYEMVTLSYTF